MKPFDKLQQTLVQLGWEKYSMNDGWYALNDGWKGYVDLKFGAERKQTMKIELDVEIPEGYEATGELRLPKKGEWFLYTGYAKQEVMQAGLDYENNQCIILRKKKRKVIVFVPDAKGAFFEDSGGTFNPQWRYRREEREEA